MGHIRPVMGLIYIFTYGPGWALASWSKCHQRPLSSVATSHFLRSLYVAQCSRRDICPTSFTWGFITNFFYAYWIVSLTLNLQPGGSGYLLSLWVITLDPSAMGGVTSNYGTVSVGQCPVLYFPRLLNSTIFGEKNDWNIMYILIFSNIFVLLIPCFKYHAARHHTYTDVIM